MTTTTTDVAVTPEKLEAFRVWLQDLTDRYYAANYPATVDLGLVPVIEFENGRKNVRIVRREKCSGSCAGFIEIETGKMMFSAGWKAPEPKKRERANLNNPESWPIGVSVYGVKKMRG